MLRDRYHVDVAGLQEFQSPQRESFLAASGGTGATRTTRPWPTTSGYGLTENSIIWRNSTMEFVSGEMIDVPYFNGWNPPRKMPVVVLLRNRRPAGTAYFINVHNPASGSGTATRRPTGAGHRDRAGEDHRAARHRPSGVPDR